MDTAKIDINCVRDLINNAILTTTYLEQLTNLEVYVFNTSVMLTARIEALQFAFGAKLGCHAQTPTDEVEVPPTL